MRVGALALPLVCCAVTRERERYPTLPLPLAPYDSFRWPQRAVLRVMGVGELALFQHCNEGETPQHLQQLGELVPGSCDGEN